LCSLVGKKLRNDFDLCLLAFSGSEKVARDEVVRRREADENFDCIVSFVSLVSERLRAHDTFTSILLRSISQDPNCSLTVLNQGPETSLRHKQVFAENLGIPTGKQLRLHRQAYRNVNAVL